MAAEADGNQQGRAVSLLRHLLRRMAWSVVTLAGVAALTFLLVIRLPADPAAALAGPAGSGNPEVVAAIRARLGPDRPVWEQFARFSGRLLRGDLGESFMTGEPVLNSILARVPATAQLALAGWGAWLIGGTLLGIWAAARPSRLREGILLGFSVLGASTPSFWLGIVLLYLFVTLLGWLPAGGTGSLRHLVLPALTLAAAGAGYYARLAHASVTRELNEDYVRTARAKGLSARAVLWRHAFRNALLPLVTLAGTDLAALLGGVVFTESVFAWNGIGRLAVDGVRSADLPVVVGIVLFSAVCVSLANLAVDLLYPLLDPRVRTAV